MRRYPRIVAAQLNSSVKRSFRGEISKSQLVPGSQPRSVKVGSFRSPDPVDLKTMAHWALSYLRNNPDREQNYRPFFLINLLPGGGAPPISGHYGWDIGDIDLRMLRAMVFAREIVGEKEPDPVEQGLIGPAAVFLLSDKLSAYTTGSELIVDGGLSLRPPPYYSDEEIRQMNL